MKRIADWDGDRRKMSGQLTVSAKLFSLLNRGLARNPAERNFENWASILDAKIFSSQNLLVAKFPTAETAVFAVVFLAAGCDLRGKR